MRYMKPQTIEARSAVGPPAREQPAAAETKSQAPRTAGVLLWSVQGLLALVFLFAGGTKLVLPVEEMTQQMELPGLFLRFIGVCEVLGALGLILPGLLRLRPGLTPLAAAGLVVIMVGATVLTLALGDGAAALMPLVVGLLAAVVAYGRWRVAPHGRPARAAMLRPAA